MLKVQRKAIEMAVAGIALARQVQKHDEKLADQLARAVKSTVLNLHEGIGRRTVPDKRSRYDIALGECKESQAAAVLAIACGYSDEAEVFLALADHTGAMIYRMRAALDRWQ